MRRRTSRGISTGEASDAAGARGAAAGHAGSDASFGDDVTPKSNRPTRVRLTTVS